MVVVVAMLACSCALVSGLSQISVGSGEDGSVPMDAGDSSTTPDSGSSDGSPDVIVTSDAARDFALAFNATCATSQIGYSFSGSAFTVELWWQPGSPPLTAEMKPLVYNGGRTAMEPGWSFGLVNLSFEFCVSDGVTLSCATAQGTMNPIGHLLHIAAVSGIGVTTRSLQLYLLDWTMGQKNHTMVGSTTTPLMAWQTTVPFSISGVPGSNNCSATLPGVVDDVRLWNRALTTQELDQGFAQTLGCQAVGMIAQYPFDEGTGTTAASLCLGKGSLTIGSAMWTTSPFP